MKRFLQLLLVFGFVSVMAAQEAPKGPSEKIYKVNFLVYEMEDGKRINERSYSMPVASVDGKPRDSSIRVGTRVPITTGGEKQVQYIDVGLNIDCNVTEQGDRFILHGNLELSSFALPEQGADPRSGGNPVLRQIRQSFTTLVSPGKPTLVTTMDDINSKKRLQVEVTATRIE
ncbi:MAG TPA: hypothetical protein VI636_05110 [Candidatus Angelobacter sp.]